MEQFYIEDYVWSSTSLSTEQSCYRSFSFSFSSWADLVQYCLTVPFSLRLTLQSYHRFNTSWKESCTLTMVMESFIVFSGSTSSIKLTTWMYSIFLESFFLRSLTPFSSVYSMVPGLWLSSKTYLFLETVKTLPGNQAYQWIRSYCLYSSSFVIGRPCVP